VDGHRLAELERRVDSDPASIAFAQLAEEYRRAGRFDDALRVCRAGLARHPAHPSARVTLARALLALGQDDAAQLEIDALAREAPNNVAVRRLVEESHQVRAADAPPAPDGALKELETWLEAIIADRRSRPHAAP
jgi:predicted Zn-dependent protease